MRVGYEKKKFLTGKCGKFESTRKSSEKCYSHCKHSIFGQIFGAITYTLNRSGIQV